METLCFGWRVIQVFPDKAKSRLICGKNVCSARLGEDLFLKREFVR
jgi:hypothetical protein